MTSHFTRTLLEWYASNGRALPWRDISDPYRIWVSEIILQQTRVAQGYDYYLRFVRRFPDVATLAAASQDEVMQQWEGLGYYSRARNLHAAAQQVMALGRFPDDYDGVRALKGVGDYTAAAICSFAFGMPTAVVDGNVYRVLSRYFGIDTPIDSTRGKKEFAALAAELIDRQEPARYNQAIMDFGALQCTPRAPQCLLCPLNESCVALSTKKIEDLPVKAKKIDIVHRYFVYILCCQGHGKERTIYIRRRSPGDIWAGLYEPLLLEFPTAPTFAEVVNHSLLAPLLRGHSALRPVVGGLRHQLTHRQLHADCYVLEMDPNYSDECAEFLLDYQSVAVRDLSSFAFPKLVNLIFERCWE